jgi:hypothetical protein
VRKRERRK